MPFKQPRYNAALTRDNNARDRLLEPSGGVYTPPEQEELDLSQFNPVTEEDIQEQLRRKRAAQLFEKMSTLEGQKELGIDAVMPSPNDLRKEALERNPNLPVSERDFVKPVQMPSPKGGENAIPLRKISDTVEQRRQEYLASVQNMPAEAPALPEGPAVEEPEQPGVPSPVLINAIKSLGTPSEYSLPEAPAFAPSPAQTMTPVSPVPSAGEQPSVPEAEVPVAPSAAPVAPQEDRLTQLARIVSMSQQPQQTDEDRRRMVILEALGQASAAMNAGLTRTPVPASVFAPPSALMQPQTKTDRLEQLYKASQILGKPGTSAEQVDPLLIADLQRQFPNAQLPSNMSLSQYREIANILNRERTEGGKTDRFKQAREQTAQQHKDRIDLAKQKMNKQEWQFVTSEIGDKQKQVAAVQSAMPVMQEVVDNSLAAYNLPGGEALRALRLGQFTPEQEQMWNVVFEQLVSPARKDLFGATLTGNELAAFNVMVGLGPNASVGTKLNALRLLMKRMQGSLKGAFGGIQDTEAFQNYRNVTGDLTHLNPLWAEFDESLAEAAANAPKAGEAAAIAGKRVAGAIKKAAKGAATTVESALGGQPTQPRVQGPVAVPTPAQKYIETKTVGGKKYGFVQEGESGYWEEIEE